MGGIFSSKKELSNVYIFNRIKNNKADIELLRATFESLKCGVTEIEVQKKKYAELKYVVNKIIKADFNEFKYIVIIILDNENEDEYTWVTCDGKIFHINGDLLVAICGNKSLEGKFRFFILQTNRVPSDDINIRHIPSRNKPKFYAGNDLRYCATSTGCVLNHQWKEDEPSPFIKVLCDEINENVKLPKADQLLITDLVDKASRQLTNEYPARTTPSKPIVLGNAK